MEAIILSFICHFGDIHSVMMVSLWRYLWCQAPVVDIFVTFIRSGWTFM